MSKGKYTKPSAGAQIDWTHPLARGLAAAWFLQRGDLRDATQKGANGSEVNAPALAVGRFGGAARQFLAASSQKVSIGVRPALNLTGAMTFVVWVNPITNPNGVYPIGDYDSIGSNVQNGLRMELGKIQAVWTGVVHVTSTGIAPLGRWSQIGMTRAGSAGAWTASVYLNGKFDKSATTVTNPSPQQSFSLGAPGAFPGQFYNGYIDHAIVYNRTLSDAEFAALYNEPFAMLQSAPIRRTYFIVPQGVVFRRTLALDGARTGSRSPQG